METNISTAAQDYKDRIRATLQTMPTIETIILEGRQITQGDLDAIKARELISYPHRENIPEAIRSYADLYHQLTGQEPTKRSFTDWIDTFWQWKEEKLQDDHIRAAWAQAQQIDKGFTVGRPGALTVTAIGCKSKAKPAIVGTNHAAVEKTKTLIEERKAAEGSYVPMPEDVRVRLRAKLKGQNNANYNKL